MAEPSKQLIEAVFKGLWAANLSNYPREYIEKLSISLATELAKGGSGPGDFSGLENIVEDLTPQLGGTLDLNSNDITGTGNIDITGNVTVGGEFLGDLDGAIRFTAKADEALSKGDVVYVSGVSGNTTTVGKAKADDTSKMPAFGMAIEDANANNNLQIVTFGNLTSIDTSNESVGEILYVSTTAGEYTTTAPSGESTQIQNIGKVLRSQQNNGSIKVGGAGRSNATPNLNNGNIFIGNGSNKTSTTAFAISLDRSPQLGGNLDVNGYDITGNPAIDGRRAIIFESGRDRTLSLEDAGDFIIATNDEPTTITIPTNNSVAFTTGTEIDFIQKGAGELTIQAEDGVTLNGVGGGSTLITAQWGGATIKKIDRNEWIIVGKINDVA